jgi:hypothetical protein
MITWTKTAGACAIVAAAICAPVSAQNYYKTVQYTDGCIIDVGRTDPPNKAYDYSYTLRSQCPDRRIKIWFSVNGTPRSSITLGGSTMEFSYPLTDDEVFQITAVEE